MALKALGILAAVGVASVAGMNLYLSKQERATRTANPPGGDFLTVDGTRLHYRIDGSGPPLVLLHGASGNLRDFDPLVAALTDRYTVVRFDRPGLGWSELPAPYGPIWRNAAPSPQEQADLLARGYDQLDLGPALVLGQSYGGAVALAWALNHAETVAGIIPVSAVSNPWPGSLSPIYPVASNPVGAAILVPMILSLSPPAAVDQVMNVIFAPQSPPDGYGDMLGIDLTLRRKSYRANARQVNDVRRHVVDMSKHYDTLSMPMEIIHGEADDIVPLEVHSVPLSEDVPNAHLTRLPGIGHMPHHSAMPEVIAAIDRAALRAGLHDATTLGTVDP